MYQHSYKSGYTNGKESVGFASKIYKVTPPIYATQVAIDVSDLPNCDRYVMYESISCEMLSGLQFNNWNTSMDRGADIRFSYNSSTRQVIVKLSGYLLFTYGTDKRELSFRIHYFTF